MHTHYYADWVGTLAAAWIQCQGTALDPCNLSFSPIVIKPIYSGAMHGSLYG